MRRFLPIRLAVCAIRLPYFVCLVAIVGMVSLPAMAAQLVWNDDAGIHRIRPGQESGDRLFETFQTRGIAAGPGDQLYWSDVLPLGSPLPGGVIRTGSLQGGSVTTIVNNLRNPAGVAILDERIYWTDLGDDQNPSGVFSANLDGSDIKTLIRETWISEIAGIAVDPQQQHLYITYVNPLLDGIYNGGIARANLDGSDLQAILGGLIRPQGIAVDSLGGMIYWADAGGLTEEPDGAIQAAGLNDLQHRTLLGGVDQPFGIALDLLEGNVYWTETATGKIQRTRALAGLPFFEDVVTDLKSPTALLIVPEPTGPWVVVPGFLAILAGLSMLRRPGRSSPW